MQFEQYSVNIWVYEHTVSISECMSIQYQYLSKSITHTNTKCTFVQKNLNILRHNIHINHNMGLQFLQFSELYFQNHPSGPKVIRKYLAEICTAALLRVIYQVWTPPTHPGCTQVGSVQSLCFPSSSTSTRRRRYKKYHWFPYHLWERHIYLHEWLIFMVN